MKLKTLSEINVKNKSVLLRIDINSPVVNGKVQNNPRFKASSITLEELLKKGAKVAILAHQGRPGSTDYLMLNQHAKILTDITKSVINYIPDLFGKKAQLAITNLKSGKAILLENVRFYDDEKDLSLNNYKKLCSHFDFYINDAFSVSHRAQGSIVLPPKYLPSAIGRQFESELSALEKLSIKDNYKLVISLGGAKVEDYFPIFELLKNKKNKILASGVLANLFLVQSGINLGYEKEWLSRNGYDKIIPKIKSLYNKYKNQIILPIDFGLNPNNNKRINVSIDQAPFKYKILDVGQKTVELFNREVEYADTVFVKGPLGFSEIDEFSYGTVTFLRHLSNVKNYRIIGGGHSATTLDKYKIPNTFNHISLSGGALIKYVFGEKLPGIEALKKSK